MNALVIFALALAPGAAEPDYEKALLSAELWMSAGDLPAPGFVTGCFLRGNGKRKVLLKSDWSASKLKERGRDKFSVSYTGDYSAPTEDKGWIHVECTLTKRQATTNDEDDDATYEKTFGKAPEAFEKWKVTLHFKKPDGDPGTLKTVRMYMTSEDKKRPARLGWWDGGSAEKGAIDLYKLGTAK